MFKQNITDPIPNKNPVANLRLLVLCLYPKYCNPPSITIGIAKTKHSL